MKKITLNNKAFSLMEIMVAVGLMSIVIYGITSMLGNTMNAQKKMTVKDDILNTSNQIRNVLGSDDLCKQGIVFTSGSSNYPTPPLPTSAALPKVLDMQQIRAGAAGQTVVKVNTPAFVGAKVASIKMTLSSLVTTTATTQKYQGQVDVAYTTTDPNGGSYRPTSYPVLVEFKLTSPYNIASCSVTTTLTEQNICENIFNGVYNSAKSPKCNFTATSFSQTTSNYVSDFGVGTSNLIALESQAADRGLNIYGANPSVNLFRDVTAFKTNTSKVALTATAAGVLGVTAATSNFSGIVNVTGNTTLNGTATVNGAGTAVSVPNGALHVGAASPNGANISVAGDLDVRNFNVRGTTTYVGAVTFNSTATFNGATIFNSTSDFKAHVSGTSANFTGSVYANQLITTSDRRLKSDITPLSSQLNKILDIKTYSYYFKNDKNKNRHFGVMADELKEIYPYLVNDRGDGYSAVNYIELIPHMIKAIQEQQKLIENLQDENAELQERLEKLERR